MINVYAVRKGVGLCPSKTVCGHSEWRAVKPVARESRVENAQGKCVRSTRWGVLYQQQRGGLPE